ncbi:MAG: glycerol-3-phosphate dehydrogenase/oxidase [Candidatus Acidiferrales bacterium]
MKSRAKALQDIKNLSFDVCVIGAGATGSGCALDAQLRGLKTVLLEGGDFASATSSTSTKMVHGGVRYLEEAFRHLDIAEYEVVKRALRERVHMLKNAPFLTRTKEFVTPCYNWLDLAYYGAGLKLYDWIAGSASLAPSHFISRDEVLRRLPNLNAQGLTGAVSYTDGQFDDARYNVTLVETFAQAGGEPLNYARVIALEKNADGKLAVAEVQDQMGGEKFVVRARAFVNATGPRADTIRTMASSGVPPRMRLSKGVHILLPMNVFSSTDAMLIPKSEDGRVLFAIPWMGRLLVGTTESEVEVDDELYLEREEVEYLLRHLNRYLAEPVSAKQAVGGFAGARPLLSSGDSRNTRRLARDHEVEFDSRTGLISIMGGKWTTYRAMAEDTTDTVQKYLGVPARPCSTLNHPLIGSDRYSAEYWESLGRQFGVSEASARHLAEKFGTRAAQVCELIAEDSQLGTSLLEGLAPLRAEVTFSVRHEMAMTIEDVLARRVGLQMYGWSEAIAAAPATAELLGRELGWPVVERERALHEYVEKILDLHRKAGLAVEPQAA